MIRWKGLIFIGILIAVFAVAILLLTDQWLENRLEAIGSSVVGAKVEIDDLDFSFTGVHLRWQRLQVTDPAHTMKNMFETGVCNFDMEFWPLLSKKYIIEDFRINNLRTQTDRATDGKLPPRGQSDRQPGFVEKTAATLSREVGSSVSGQFSGYKQKVNVDSILKILDLKSVQRIDSLQKQLRSNYTAWDQELSQLHIEKDVRELESKVRSIDVNNIKKLDQLQSTLKTADEVKKQTEALADRLKESKNRLLSDLDQARQGLKQVDNWISDDYKRARSMAKLPDFSAKNIGQMIFGPQLINRFNSYLGYVGTARNYASKLQSGKPEKEKPPRLQGQDIYFFNKNARPDLWIKEINLSGETADQLKLQGVVTNIVSDQRFIQKTTDIDISGKKDNGASLELNGTLNYLGEAPSEKFQVRYAGMALAGTRLSSTNYLPHEVKKGRGTLKANLDLIGEKISSQIRFDADNLAFDMGSANPKNDLDRIVRKLVDRIKHIDFTAMISGQPDKVTFRLSSNLDEMFAENLKAVLSEEVEAAKKKLQQRIDQEVSKYRDQVYALVNEKETEFRAELAKYQKLIDEQVQRVDAKKKELEQRIEDEKKKLGKDATKKLKNLLN